MPALSGGLCPALSGGRLTSVRGQTPPPHVAKIVSGANIVPALHQSSQPAVQLARCIGSSSAQRIELRVVQHGGATSSATRPRPRSPERQDERHLRADSPYEAEPQAEPQASADQAPLLVWTRLGVDNMKSLGLYETLGEPAVGSELLADVRHEFFDADDMTECLARGWVKQQAVRAAPSQVPRLKSPGQWRRNARPTSDERSARTNEEEQDWADDFISHRKISNYAHRTEEVQLEQTATTNLETVGLTDRTASGSSSPTASLCDRSARSEPDDGAEEMEVINCRTLREELSQLRSLQAPADCRTLQEELAELRSLKGSSSVTEPGIQDVGDKGARIRLFSSQPAAEPAQQAQTQEKLKRLIQDASADNRNGNEKLQKNLEDWMVRREQAQQEQVISADRQIRNLQHEVEQLRALHAKEKGHMPGS